MPQFQNPALYFWLCLALGLLGTPLARLLALRFNILDHPKAGAHKHHREPTPYLGGLAMFLGLSWALWHVGTNLYQPDGSLLGVATAAGPRELNLPLAIGAVAYIFLLGLYDDITVSEAGYKMAHIGVASTLLYIAGVGVEFTPWHLVNYPLTLFWMLGITNAANLMDNMNGLSSGTGAIVAFGYAILAAQRGDLATMASALALCGGLMGFWVYNFPKARIFMGDAGAMTLGFTLAMLGLLDGRSSDALKVADPTLPQTLAAIYMVGIFIADTFFVAFSRGARKIHFWEGGKDHTSHRFVNLGLTPVQAVLACYSLAAILAGAAAGLYFLPSAPLGIVGAIAIVAAGIAFWRQLDRVPVKG
ncbi:MAG TPA: MraY family glycosyltransferase [bacterium]|nr:MraY family glycosyltransferase [bacterium]